MASRIPFIRPASGEIEEDDFFPALFAETYPLPAATALQQRNVSPLRAGMALPSARQSIDSAAWAAARKERVA